MFNTASALTLIHLVLAAVPRESLDPLLVTLHLHVEVPDSTVEHLRAEVEQIYAPAGVHFDWSSGSEARFHVVLQSKPERKVITGCSRNLHDHRLGRAAVAGRRITLWTEHVARAVAGDWDSRRTPRVSGRALGRALGRVLAHELGHLLLALNEHRPRGLMRSSFRHRDLSARSRRAFMLSSEDIERIREGLEVFQTMSSPN